MRRLLQIAAFSWLALVVSDAVLHGAGPLKMDVSPSVSRAPAVLTVRVVVQAGNEDRYLQVVAESPTFYRSSEIQLEGTKSTPLNVFEFRNVPTGLYQITGVLVDAHGPRANISRLVKVEPSVGSR
jgi:hypothetical protein